MTAGMTAGNSGPTAGNIHGQEGHYANRLHVGHNAFEFVLDFLQEYGDQIASPVRTRVVTSPAYAKAFLHALTVSIDEYEREFGVIGSIAHHE